MADPKEPKIRKYYKPTDREEELLAHVYERYRSMKDNHQRKDAEDEWDSAEKAWDQYSKEDEGLEEWQADYYVPRTTAIVETILSEMISQSPQPIILPRSAEDKPKATVMRHAFEYTWDVADGNDELENVLKDALIYGNGFAQEYYWKDRRIVKSLKGVKKEQKKRVEEYNEIETFDYDDCYMESVAPYELFFDETARSINRGPYKSRDAIRRYVMKIESFRQFFKGDIWDPLNNVRYVRPGGDTNWYAFYRPPEDVDKSNEVEVLWYWSRSPEDWLIIVANDVLIKAGPNPYKHKQLPFAMTMDVKRPHKFFHKGEPKLLESIQKEVNMLRRMLTDRNHMDIDKMWLVGRNETYSEEDTITRPHGIIRVDDPSNYKPLEYGDVGQSFFMSLDEINKDAVRISGVDDRLQSVKTPGTATEAAIIKEATIQRVAAKLRRLENGFLVDVGRMRVANIIQFYSQPKLEKIVGEAGTEEYRKLILQAQKKGVLQSVNGQPYAETYKNIRVKGKELIRDERGEIKELPHKGYTFFEMTPESFIPVARGGFDIKFKAGATMPVSKSLMTKQIQDAATMLMPLATAGIGYDPVKLGDELLKSLDLDPQDYHVEDVEKDMQGARDEMVINLASQENEEVISGRPIPPMGTPYATPSHTMIHIGFLRSTRGKSMAQPLYEALVKHIMGEITAQGARGEVASLTGEGQPPIPTSNVEGAAPPQSGVAPAGAPYNQEMKATMPALKQGGEENTGTQKGSILNRVFGLLKRPR